jgi:hypothetical protein
MLIYGAFPLRKLVGVLYLTEKEGIVPLMRETTHRVQYRLRI